MTLLNSPNTTSGIALVSSYEFIYVLISTLLFYKWSALESHISHYCLIIPLEMYLKFLLLLIKNVVCHISKTVWCQAISHYPHPDGEP